MDELDRMFRRLVHNVRSGYPDLLTRPFEVSVLHQQLIPYRLNRREIGIDSAEEYELALMRLLSGARGLLSGDGEMQEAIRAELESANPDLSSFRAWGTSTVELSAAAVRALDGAPAPQPQPPTAPSVTRQADLAGRATQELPASGSSTAVPRQEPAPSAPQPAPPRAAGAGCRYCGGELPEGRDVHFCPHCGQNLALKQCPACSTELEVEWQYCITCGRQVE